MDVIKQIEAKVQITGTLVFHDAQGKEVGTIELKAETPLEDAHEVFGEWKEGLSTQGVAWPAP